MRGTMRLKIVVSNRTLVSQIGDNGFRSGLVFIYLRHNLSKRANPCTEGSNPFPLRHYFCYLVLGKSFKAIPVQPANLAFVQEMK